MFTRENRFVHTRLTYGNVTPEGAEAVAELLKSENGRENTLVVMGFTDYDERSRQLSVVADLQSDVGVEDLATAVERSLASVAAAV